MSSKLTGLTESSPSVLLPSVLCGLGIFSWLGSPWSMASLCHFDPTQTYDGYKAVEVFDPAFNECLKKGKQRFKHCNPFPPKLNPCFVGEKACQRPGAPIYSVRRYLWSKKDGAFEKEFPAPEAPIPDGTSGYYSLTGSRKRDLARCTNVGGPIPVSGRPIYYSSEVPISRVNSQGVVKRLRKIANSPTDPNAEGSDDLNGEVEVVPNSIGHQSSSSTSQPASR
ncbi:hypothetical protein O181_006035 [Austropuccinia psidii MF-1]|uniref:Uncharacterized protein n=1 Tax=Austropuccinia psidii MF-1 TaxID=1389203 RepID=A0A9Q3BK57_9BASI|nr:hypothetical protein [Austropuccinia psidii MF-1]